ncbi:MAG: hypothetical protein CVU56_20210 [Deltaproteobacteria bacterium HGW-Deltaproteobacteria-14]|nr:MAG: hypothetical protein CVU56_20210 [Deltaproteobacteria bacterium HGW-Deltaproteobacteria-14]
MGAAVGVGFLTVGILIPFYKGLAPWRWRRATRRLPWDEPRERGGDRVGAIDGVHVHVALEVNTVHFEVTHEDAPTSKTTYRSLVTVGQQLAPPEVEVSREGLFARTGEGDDHDVEIGDPAFDRALKLLGSEVDVLATLHRDVRPAMLEALRRSGTELRGGGLQLALAGVPPGRRLPRRVMELVALAKTMRGARREPAESLLDSARHDPCEGVRRRCGRALLTQLPTTAQADALAAELVEGDDDELRVVALERLGVDAERDRLAAVVRDEGTAPAHRAEALRALASAPSDGFVTLIGEALATPAPPLRRAALDIVARLRLTAAVPAVAANAGHGDTAEARRAAQIIGELGGPDHEAALVGLLSVDDDEVALHLTDALGRWGTPQAIEHLQPLTSGAFRKAHTKMLARDAIDAIRTRYAHGERGGLALTEAGPEGALSMSDEAG